MSAQQKQKDSPVAALIYCRVSSARQKIEGGGLESQEHRCREYAAGKGYQVEAVFPDDYTGGGDFMKRPGMCAMLAYLDAQSERKFVVIFDDLKRFARDTEFHLQLRREFKSRGAQIECLNFNFEDTPEGRFVETILAAQGELERQQNRRQTVQKMKARVERGYWVFHTPLGLRHQADRAHGKILVRDEPIASIIQEAMEGFASGRFASQSEVKRFLEAQPDFPKDFPDGTIRVWRVTTLLSNPLYAGYVEVPKWGVSLRKGQHEGLVSLETFRKIQERLEGGTKAPARKDINQDFPLRNFVECADCGNALTSCWSKGKYKKYPYYICQTRGCPSKSKSIPRAAIEGEFEEILKGLQPSKGLFMLVREMFKDAWEARLAQAREMAASFELQIAKAEKQIEQLVFLIVDASSPAVIGAYEQRIAALETEKLVAIERLSSAGAPQRSFEECIELSMRFLSSPWKIWTSGRLELQKTVLRLAFTERLAYRKNEGYRTPELSFPFKTLSQIQNQQCEMVPGARLELARSRIGGF